MANGFTPTERRMADLLADGLSHSRQELRGCLNDELTSVKSGHLRAYISTLRRKIRPLGQDIICEMRSEGVYYRQVPLLHPERARKS